ncbi:MAG: hypothetical protein M1812_007686 [Candelaria pacifica]|nr:MAG: hypothetical protein M1812_007686 [Candelaria pacifica]
MTRSISGASSCRQDSSSPPKSPVRKKQQIFDFGTLPLNAPEILVKNTIYVRDPNRILLLKETDRRRDYQTLVNRFIRQLLHGCQEPSCSTPTCFTCRRRVSNAPVRKYTELSARTLAIYLASQDDPEKDLCPHDHVLSVEKPNSERAYLERLGRMIREQDTANPTFAEDGISPSWSEEPALSSSVNVAGTSAVHDTPSSTNFKDGGSRASKNGPIPPDITKVAPNEAENSKSCEEKPTALDPKSLTQNLFDTLPMKLLSWLAIPSLHTVARFAPEKGVEATTSNKTEAVYRLPQHSELQTAMKNGTSNSDEDNQLPGQEAQTEEIANHRDPKAAGSASPASQKPSKSPSKDQTTKPRGVRFSSRKAAMYMPTYPDGFSRELRPPPQTLSHLSFDSVMVLIGAMNNSGFYSSENCMVRSFGKDPDTELAGRRMDTNYKKMKTFVRQSIYYGLSHTEGLTRSFKRPSGEVPAKLSGSLPDIDTTNLDHAFRSMVMFDRPLVLHSLWQALEGLFVPPPELTSPRSPRLKAALNSSFSTDFAQPVSPKPVHIGDLDAANIVVICLHALAAAVPRGSSPEAWHAVRQLRAQGQVLPAQNLLPVSEPLLLQMLRAIDTLEDDSGLRLMSRLVRSVHARERFSEVLKVRSSEEMTFDDATNSLPSVITSIQRHLIHFHKHPDAHASAQQGDLDLEVSSVGWSLPAVTIDWIRSVMLREWDGKGEVKRSGVVGSALEMLSHLYEIHDQIGLSPEAFQTPFLSDRLDPIDMPVEWLTSTPSSKTVHLLSYPFLFPPPALVGYFRALNHSNMTKAFDTSLTSARLVAQMVFADPFADDSENRVFNRLKLAVDLFLLLKIRRSHVLEDALNQLWRREKRELMRPLKVQMGMDEGEEGLDIGGVQQEFFRAAIGEASNPDYGVFHTDPMTQFSWFQICSFEPLYKFELLGLLVSLAVYNGNTVPLNFPKALYRKLLSLPVTEIQHIRDGWPDKAKGFTELLAWDGEDDVGDVFAFSYEFSFDLWDKQVNLDMDRYRIYDGKMPFRGLIEMSHRGLYPPRSSGASSSPSGNHDKIERPRSPELAKTAKRKGKGKLTASPVDDAENCVPSDRLHSAESNQGDASVPEKQFPLLNGEAKSGRANTGDFETAQQKQPALVNGTSHDEEAKLVTNENRLQFVEDYIHWLTDISIRPQYEAFARGFFVCIDKTAVSLFNAEALQTMVEGIPDIDIDGLERVARYEEPYDSTQRVIKDFWIVVKNYPLKRQRQLLEFVTASDRVPANGVGSITFVIMRAGPDSERLPSSTTCFGRLLLPEYSSREKLKTKLDAALEHTRGFGNM